MFGPRHTLSVAYIPLGSKGAAEAIAFGRLIFPLKYELEHCRPKRTFEFLTGNARGSLILDWSLTLD